MVVFTQPKRPCLRNMLLNAGFALLFVVSIAALVEAGEESKDSDRGYFRESLSLHWLCTDRLGRALRIEEKA